MKPKVILYIAMSKDGYIAADNDNLDFLNKYQVPNEDYGYTAFMERVGCIIVGRRTYDKVLSMGFPYHDDKMVFVLSREKRIPQKENLQFYNGDLKYLFNSIQLEENQIVYCDGGAQIAQLLISENLIDEMIISIVPDILQTGTLLFNGGEVPKQFKMESKIIFSSGLIQHHYLNTNPL
jgi:dihydrofolate reductase